MSVPQPASIGIYCKGKPQLAFLDKKTGGYFCQCCGTGPLALAW